jgi:hypothetical protein
LPLIHFLPERLYLNPLPHTHARSNKIGLSEEFCTCLKLPLSRWVTNCCKFSATICQAFLNLYLPVYSERCGLHGGSDVWLPRIIYDHGNGSVFCRGVGHRLLSSINAVVVAFTLLFQFWCPLHDSCIAPIILIMTLINQCDC